MNDDKLSRLVAVKIAGYREDANYIPPYANNILHTYDAEELIATKGLQPAYERALLAVVERDAGGLATPFQLIHATERQRCEAMLEAVNEGK